MEEEEEGLSPLRIILAVFLILIIILMIVPFYSIKLNPHPKQIPSVHEVFDKNLVTALETVNSTDIREFVDTGPLIKLTADRIVSYACDSSNKICHAKAIYLFVRDNIIYISDPGEYYETPTEVLLGSGSDCDGMAILTASLMRSVGIETRFVMIPGHVFVQIYLDEAPNRYKIDGWINIDPTCKTCEFGQTPIKNARTVYIS